MAKRLTPDTVAEERWLRRVSKDGREHRLCYPSFETLASLVPQDEVCFLFSTNKVATSQDEGVCVVVR